MTLSLRHDGGENSSKGENPAPLHWRLPDAARSQSFANPSMFLRKRHDKGAIHQLWEGGLVAAMSVALG